MKDVSNPESYEDLVELLVPVLQRRGIMWEDYDVPGGTYRENMLRTPGQSATPEGHASRKFTFEALKGNMDEEGVIVINRQDPEAKVEKVEGVAKLAEATNGLRLSEHSEAVKVSA